MDLTNCKGVINNVTSVDKRDKEEVVKYGGKVSYNFVSQKVGGSANFSKANNRSILHESGVNIVGENSNLGNVKHVKAPKKSKYSSRGCKRYPRQSKRY